ncbi:Bug family tripartite tricarboxylate transporter substrate binding protein [Aquabacterium sp.]|uniref:Bug family tripartite tricarboxylate transporter substrate binding protein n=1 Tax=Aquabacterium sp. TaxID=1872578 RepID=UPI002D171DE8|nr:tripartite tricarboxylate transporter substrate binding protein [Aquabacterium sp.]HSW06780.1 tripartite tricarboxylate transporter substrate binding protein [Aquabacterium sp.]
MQRRHLLTAALPLFTGLGRAQAAAFPEHAIRVVLGFPPGTAADLLARALTQKVSDSTGWRFVVDNRPGAGGQIAAQAVCKSPADGYTLLLGELGAIAIAPAAFSKLPYNPLRELSGLATIAGSDMVFLIPASLPAQTVAEYVALMRTRKHPVLYSTLGAGSPVHFGGEMLAAAAGFAAEPVHFRSGPDATAALASGDVQGGFASTAVAKLLVATGKIRALATTAAQRTPLFPQLPTFAESGFAQLNFTSWFALLAPSGTPDPVRQAIEQAMLAALRTPDIRARLIDNGFTEMAAGAEATQALVRSETERWAQVVKASGFKTD